MHACFRKAAELAADWTEGRDLQRLWPELSAEQLDKASQVCLGFAHADVIARLPDVDKRARAWGALHTLLLQKPKLYGADEPAELQAFGAGAVDDQLRVLQAGARVFWLLDSAKGHFDVGKVETASACAKQAVSVARAEFGHADVAQYFDTNILDHAAKQNLLDHAAKQPSVIPQNLPREKRMQLLREGTARLLPNEQRNRLVSQERSYSRVRRARRPIWSCSVCPCRRVSTQLLPRGDGTPRAGN
jgi:hypothetical protein